MDVERGDHEVGIALDNPVNVDQGHHKARPAAVRVLEDALKVFVHADGRRFQRVENREHGPGRHLKVDAAARRVSGWHRDSSAFYYYGCGK